MKCGKTLRDNISNEAIREMIGVEKVEEFLREQRLRWFEHMEKIDDERATVKTKFFVVNDSKRDRLKKK